MQQALTKYKIGLLVIGLFTVAMVVVVLAQASAAKHDTDTYKTANTIADKLNGYTLDHETVPRSLSDANIDNPSTAITYTKLTDTQYKFCITYKTTSTNFDPGMLEGSLLLSGHTPEGFDGYTSQDYLVVPTAHKKGSNCQTINLAASFPLNETPTPQTTSDFYCGQPHPGGNTDDATVTSISANTNPATITVSLAGTSTYQLASDVKVLTVSCTPASLSEVLTGDSVRLIFDKPNSKTVAAVIDTSF